MKTIVKTIRWPTDETNLWKQCRVMAIENDISLAALIVAALQEYVDNHKP